MMRAMASVAPPGGNGTIMVTGRDGYVCAAAVALPASVAASAALQVTMTHVTMVTRPFTSPNDLFRRRNSLLAEGSIVGAALGNAAPIEQALLHLRHRLGNVGDDEAVGGAHGLDVELLHQLIEPGA